MTITEIPSKSWGMPRVNRAVPLGPSIPTKARAKPIPKAATPRITDSETTAEMARKANTARAKYSAGPKRVAILTSVGAKKTTKVVAIKAPIAQVASALAACPLFAMRIYDMRILLEEEAARQAAKFRRFPDLMRLEALLQRDRELQDPDDHARITTNLEFHAAV